MTSGHFVGAPKLANGLSGRHFSSNLSSLADPSPTLFPKEVSIVNAGVPNGKDDADAQLRADIKAMGSILGRIIKEHEGQGIFVKVEEMRAMAKTWREKGAGRDEGNKEAAAEIFAELADYAKSMTKEELVTVSRAFTHFLAIANTAESHHRVRRLDESIAKSSETRGGLFPKDDSLGRVFSNLLDAGKSPSEVHDALCSQTVELVLTAHPTEVNRRTILEKKRRLQRILKRADELRLEQQGYAVAGGFENDQLDMAMEREISSIWLSDEVPRSKPTPETEAEKGTLVLETVLWNAVPGFLRKVDATSKEFLDQGLPLDACPIRFASWMGGDRDGNPNVVPDTTRQVCLKNREKAARLFAQDLRTLRSELSLTVCNESLREKVGGAREPYRAFLKSVCEKMEKTAAWSRQELDKLVSATDSMVDLINPSEIYVSKDEFRSDLMEVYNSLVETKNDVAADGILTDIIRNISSFGLTLIPLDVRQESDRHEEAVDAITRYLGLGSYSQWDEQTKVSWLTTQITSKRPLLRSGVWSDNPDHFSGTVVDTLETFKMIAEQPEDSLGAYVISQATHASDVLAVLLLQLDAGVTKPLRVAPLFETLDDLNGACDTMKMLFDVPSYMGIINGKQEIMIGYSDSAKDAGRLAATWAQFKTQESLAQLGKENGVNITFFHGKGGTVGRGGNPQTFLAIKAHAPNTINGQFRVTEQGEMINQNFGYIDRAERSLDIYTAAVLSEKLSERREIKPEWRELMDELSDISCEAYRDVVRHDDRFVPYFRSATPELELSGLNIGSRPAKRKATGGVESLRAIPWNFAWTQTRFNLPTWLGVGKALGAVLKSDKEGLLRELYSEGRALSTMADLVEMVLAKSEPAIAAHYDSVLVNDPAARDLGNHVRKAHLETEEAILDLTNHKVLGENNLVLQRQLSVRNPYVDCLNVLQVEVLSRIRRAEEGGEDDPILRDALMTTITGVANGMGNTG